MVRVRADDGGYFHEPPYTEEEQMEMYRRMSMCPGSSFTSLNRLPAAPAPAEPQAERKTLAARQEAARARRLAARAVPHRPKAP